MKISAFFLNNVFLKLMPGAIIFIVWGVTFNNKTLASTLTIQGNNNYDLEELSYFSLKLNRDIYNQLEKEILQQESDFSEYIDLIDKGLNSSKYRFKAEPNILVQSEENREEKILGSFLDSLRKLELQAFSANYSYQASIPVLPQVSYRNVYKDIYDFDVSLADYSQQKNSIRRGVRTTVRTQQWQGNKYFSSYFQGNKNPDYSSYKNKPENINNPQSSLLTSPQKKPTLASLTSSPLVDLPLENNKSKSSFLQNLISNIDNQYYPYSNEDDSQLENDVQAVYLPSTNIEIYQFNNFDVPSALSSYQKPEYQEELDKEIEKQKDKLEKQKQKMAKKLTKLQEKRGKTRKKELEKYKKERQKALTQAMKQQEKLHQQRQRQFR